jgi:hypothetical protein
MRKNDRRSNTSQYLPQSAIYAAKRGLSMRTNVKTLLATGTAAIAIGLSAGSAQAVTFSFNLTPNNLTTAVGNFPGVPSLSFSQGGIGLTATAVDENNTPRNVIQNNQGLGVYIPGVTPLPDSVQIDANGLDETLRLSFNQTVRIVSAVFSRVGIDIPGTRLRPPVATNDYYNLSSDTAGALATNRDIPGGDLADADTGLEDFTAFLSSTQRTGSIFNFSVPGGGGLASSDYQLRSIEVEAVPVPTPALLPGLIGLGLGLVRKRKQEALGSV